MRAQGHASERLLRWAVAAIAVHSLLLATLMLWRPLDLLSWAGWSYEGTRFFPAQSGIFLLILGIVYAAGLVHRPLLWVIVMSKGLAFVFLFGEAIRGSCPRIVLLQAIADGLMGAVILYLLLRRACARES